LADGQCLGASCVERVSAALNAGQQPNNVPGGRGKSCFIIVIDIKIDQPVVALVAAVIFEVQVAAAPSQGRIEEEGRIWQSFIEQVAGAAQEDERALSHLCVLHGQALGVAAGVVTVYCLDDVRVAHWECTIVT